MPGDCRFTSDEADRPSNRGGLHRPIPPHIRVCGASKEASNKDDPRQTRFPASEARARVESIKFDVNRPEGGLA